jgi:hypothetical protein
MDKAHDFVEALLFFQKAETSPNFFNRLGSSIFKNLHFGTLASC